MCVGKTWVSLRFEQLFKPTVCRESTVIEHDLRCSINTDGSAQLRAAWLWVPRWRAVVRHDLALWNLVALGKLFDDLGVHRDQRGGAAERRLLESCGEETANERRAFRPPAALKEDFVAVVEQRGGGVRAECGEGGQCAGEVMGVQDLRGVCRACRKRRP